MISAAGFGRRTGWGEDEVPPGHNMSFKRSLGFVSTGVFIRVLCPKWIFEWAPTEKIREARDKNEESRKAYNELLEKEKHAHKNSQRCEDCKIKTTLLNEIIISHPNAIVTPHNAFNSTEAIQRIIDMTIDNIKSFADGKIKNEVTSPKLKK